MYDRPNLAELLDAVRVHLEGQIIPEIKANRKLYFQTLVAINLLKVAERELALHTIHQKNEHERLNAIQGASGATLELAERNRQLCAAIRAGEFDDGHRQQALLQHLLATTLDQLAVANPKFLETEQNNE